MTIMQTRTLGPFTVSAIGLGGMPMSTNNDRVYPSDAEAIATVHAALDAGVHAIAPHASIVRLTAPPLVGAAMLGLDLVGATRAAHRRARASLTHERLSPQTRSRKER